VALKKGRQKDLIDLHHGSVDQDRDWGFMPILTTQHVQHMPVQNSTHSAHTQKSGGAKGRPKKDPPSTSYQPPSHSLEIKGYRGPCEKGEREEGERERTFRLAICVITWIVRLKIYTQQ